MKKSFGQSLLWILALLFFLAYGTILIFFRDSAPMWLHYIFKIPLKIIGLITVIWGGFLVLNKLQHILWKEDPPQWQCGICIMIIALSLYIVCRNI